MNNVLSVSALKRIDVACDDFEEAWRRGRLPRIENYLALCETEERDHLLKSLQQLQQELERDYSLQPLRESVRLKVFAGPHEGQEFEYHGHATLLVGRSAVAKLRLKDDPHFSRHHFRLEFKPPTCYLLDLQSRNGTFVNGERVTGRFLNDGDVISGGRTRIQVAIQSSQFASDLSAAEPPHRSEQLFSNVEKPQIAGYQIHEQVGAGELGIVYRTTRLGTDEACALKAIYARLRPDGDALRTFVQGIRSLAELQHPHIVRLIETGASDQCLYLISEFVSATPWSFLSRDWLPEQRIHQASAAICQVLEALEYAHARGVVHREIKPGNILLVQSEDRLIAKLADFGLALQHAAAGMSRITTEHDAVDALPFMSPEQFINSREAQPVCDIYSVGATLYWMIAGKGPIDLDNAPRRFLAILEGAPIPIREFSPQIPEALARLIHKSLEKAPENRFLSAAEMRCQLQPFALPRP